jgi:hypothetical protein
MTCESVAIDTDSRNLLRVGLFCAETCDVGRLESGSTELSRSVARQKRIREDFDLLTERSSFHLAKPSANEENDNPNDRADRHDDQLKSEIQLIQNQQRQKDHRRHLKSDSKVMQHRFRILKCLKKRGIAQDLRVTANPARRYSGCTDD